jgi:hypothetical protein
MVVEKAPEKLVVSIPETLKNVIFYVVYLIVWLLCLKEQPLVAALILSIAVPPILIVVGPNDAQNLRAWLRPASFEAGLSHAQNEVGR